MQSYWQCLVIANRKCPYLSDFWKHEKISFVEQVSQENKKEKIKEEEELDKQYKIKHEHDNNILTHKETTRTPEHVMPVHEY